MRSLAVVLALALVSGSLDAESPPSVPDLPRTDGEGPAPAPPPGLGAIEGLKVLAEGRLACEGPCTTPFGQLLGVADGAEARSNCVSRCIRPDPSFYDPQTGRVAVLPKASVDPGLRFVGIAYQCVGYARQWWMKNLGLTYGDVDTADDIFYLTEGTDLRTGQPVPLGRSLNGTARRPPQRGDLVVYAADRRDPEWRAGHVAVVVSVDRDQGLVALAEQNYDNRPWQDPGAFARRIQLFEVNGRYTLLDVPAESRRNGRGGRILGWLYPSR